MELSTRYHKPGNYAPATWCVLHIVDFPANGNGFGRYGGIDAGGVDSVTGENVGPGDHFLDSLTAAALFGLTNVLSNDYGFTMSFGDMSSSYGTDPWQPGQIHHAGHGHYGNRTGLDVDFRYLDYDGASFQDQHATSNDNQFSYVNNQAVYDTARTFGFTVNYQGTDSYLSGVRSVPGHNDHGHLGFNQANARIVRRQHY